MDKVIEAVDVSKLFDAVGVKVASKVTDPVLFGAGNVQLPVVAAMAIAVQAGNPPPPIVKSTLPACEVVIKRTGLAPTGVEVPPP
jgi:hypothetical protein